MGEFKGGDEASLLVQAEEVTDKIDNGVLFLKGFAGWGLNYHRHVTRVYPIDMHIIIVIRVSFKYISIFETFHIYNTPY